MRNKVLRELRNRKVQTYLLLGVGLCVGYSLVRGSTWQSSPHFHTVLEVIATLLALMVGVMALVRYHSVKDNTILFIGTGFFGTALLDGFHAVVTSTHFKPMMPSALPHLIPWSWVASRLFLSVLLFLSWLAWRRGRQLAKNRDISARGVYVTVGALTLASFLFFIFAPLPRAYYPEFVFHRPEEFVPAFFFLAALIGYLRKGAWRTDPLEHWLVLSLIVGFLGQAAFMSLSGRLFDLEFDVAHNLKSVSYVLVLGGLMMSMFVKFREVEASAGKIAKANEAMKGEIKVREQAEANLLKAEEHTRMILTTLADAVVTIDKKGTITSINPAGVAMFGYEPLDLIDCNIKMLMPEEDSTQHDRYMSNHVKTGSSKVIGKGRELFGRRKDGSTFPMELTVSEILSAGEPGYTGILRDITERRKAQEALATAQSRLIEAIESIPDGFAIYDREDRLVMANQHLRDIHPGMADLYVAGRTYEEIIRDAAGRGLFPNSIGREEEWVQDRLRQYKGGQNVPEAKTTAGRWIKASDKPTKEGGTVSLRTDVTELKRREMELKRSNDELERFAYVASHDLQEPLRKIQAFGDRLAQKYGDAIPEEGRDYVIRMQDASARMRTLISDLLDFARVTSSGKPFEQVDLNQIIQGVVGDLEVALSETGARVDLGDLPTITADPSQMRQLFQNLIGNALKFQRPDTAPVISVQLTGAVGASGECEIVVEDNGIGFDGKHGARIFEMFQRLHNRTEYAGTGVGLAICRRIVQRHRGTIEAEGRPGKGATFRIQLPERHEREESIDEAA